MSTKVEQVQQDGNEHAERQWHEQLDAVAIAVLMRLLPAVGQPIAPLAAVADPMETSKVGSRVRYVWRADGDSPPLIGGTGIAGAVSTAP